MLGQQKVLFLLMAVSRSDAQGVLKAAGRLPFGDKLVAALKAVGVE